MIWRTSGNIYDFFEIRNNKYPTIYNLSGEHNIGTKSQLKSLKTKIDSDTLDNFAQRNRIGNIDLMKIDTEGCEDLILKEGFHTIDIFKPIIICEVLYNRIEKPLEEIMLRHNYEFFVHNGKALSKVKTIQRKSDDGIRNCFFVHPSKNHLI